MTIEQTLSSLVIKAVKALYDIDAAPQQVQLQKTRPEFEGNITVVVFPFVKAARKACGENMRIAIKADKTTPYKTIKNVMNSLRSIDESRYNLITTLKSGE